VKIRMCTVGVALCISAGACSVASEGVASAADKSRAPELSVSHLRGKRAVGAVPTVSWSTANGGPGRVVVTGPDGITRLLAEGPSGNKPAPWISPNAAYSFRLYGGTNTERLLATLRIRRSVAKGAVVATPAGIEPTSAFVNRLLQLSAPAGILVLLVMIYLRLREPRRVFE
jgi:hypothetical protein